MGGQVLKYEEDKPGYGQILVYSTEPRVTVREVAGLLLVVEQPGVVIPE